jgi:hypothetical protein
MNDADAALKTFRQDNIEVERLEGAHWRFTCLSYAPPEFHCVVRRATLLSRLEELMGQPDIKVGTPAFDRSFLIFSDEPSLVSLWFSERIQRLMLKLLPSELHISGETLWLEWRGLLSNKEPVSNISSLLSALREVSTEVYASWEGMARLCQGAVISPTPRWDLWRTQLKATYLNIPLSLYLVRQSNGELSTCIEWQRRDSRESYTVQPTRSPHGFIPGYSLLGLDDARRDEIFQPALKERLCQLPLSRLEITPQGVKWLLPGVGLSEETLRAVLLLFIELWPAPNQGPYR